MSENDRREAPFKQKEEWRVVVLAPSYQNSDLRAVSASAVNAFRNGMGQHTSLSTLGVGELLSSEEQGGVNELFLEEPALMAKAHAKGIDGLVMVEVKDARLESAGAKVSRSNSPTITRTYARTGRVTLRVKALDTFDMKPCLARSVMGESRVGDTSLDTKAKVLVSAARNAVATIEQDVAACFMPRPTVVEVRGDGLWVKINAGSAMGIRKGDSFGISSLMVIKDPDGRPISKEERRITEVRAMIVRPDHCWCDAKLSQGMIIRGYVATPLE